MEDHSYPDGDGKRDCPQCRGRGVIPIPRDQRPPLAVGEITQPCGCVLVRDLIFNLERGWRNLSKAEPLSSSSLCGKEEMNLWITGSTHKFRAHLKHVASRMGPRWDFRVVSDADLMDAWLSRNIDVMDPDVDQMRKSQVSGKFVALSDIAVPPGLLIIRLGVKAARNVAMPEVFLEALQLREQEGKPTWVTDQPSCKLEDGHRAYSGQVEEYLEYWDHFTLKEDKPEKSKNTTTGMQVMTLSDDAPEAPSVSTPKPVYERTPLPEKVKKQGTKKRDKAPKGGHK